MFLQSIDSALGQSTSTCSTKETYHRNLQNYQSKIFSYPKAQQYVQKTNN